MYRPRPYNGSGDSPRPPFLTEFVNHIREVFFAHVVYHLFGGALTLRIHPHIEWAFRLKTETPCGVFKLHGADADVCQQPVYRFVRNVLGYLSKARMQERDPWPVVFQLRWRLAQTPFCLFQGVGILIEPDQMTLCAEELCDGEAVPGQSQGRVDISPTAPDG